MGLLAVVLVAAGDTTGVSSLADADISVVKSAVSTVRLVVLVEEVRVEHVARSVRLETLGDSCRLVLGILRNSVVGAKLGIVWTGDELAAHPVARCVDSLAAAAAGLGPSSTVGVAAGGDSRDGQVGLVPSIATGDDYLELLTVLSLVSGSGGIEVRPPKSALVRGHGSWVRAPVTPDGGSSAVIGARSDRGISLDEEVERSAESGVVAVRSTLSGVVCLESVETKVGLSAGRSVKVFEGLDVNLRHTSGSGRSNGRSTGSGCCDHKGSRRCHRVEWSVSVKGRNGIRGWHRTISVRLRSARVLGVDEAAVGAFLRSGGACGSAGDGGSTSGVLSNTGSGRVIRSVEGCGATGADTCGRDYCREGGLDSR